jgi:uncharacterized protein DUF1508
VVAVDAVVTLYRDKVGEWRWQLRHANGKVLADSGEGYVRKLDCLAMVGQLFPSYLVETVDQAPAPR